MKKTRSIFAKEDIVSKILVCSNFNGRYNHTYIGHEFINIFPSDSRQWYFYVSSYGTVRKEFGKDNEPDYLVMVEFINGTYRLLGVATGLEYVSNCYSKTDKKEVMSENAEHGSISYFGRSLYTWFSKQSNTLYVSYKLKPNGKIYFPKDNSDIIVSLKKSNESDTNKNKEIYIHEEWATSEKERKKLIGQRQRSYYEEKNGHVFVDKINQLLKDELLYDATTIDPLDPTVIKETYKKFILDFIGKVNNETILSHWLAEYVSNLDFYNFLTEKIGLLTTSDLLDVTTEKADKERNRVDISIETDDEIILIENKIQSSIHESKANGLKVSQLDAYLNAIKKDLEETGKTKPIRCFLLCPDYYEKYGYAGNPKLWNKEIWIPLHYSTLKKIIDDFMVTCTYSKDKSTKYIYMDELSKAFGRHESNKPETLKERILRNIAAKL